MGKVKNNLSSIEQKFQELKKINKEYDKPLPIGQMVQIMTDGVVSQKQVSQYMQYVQSLQSIEQHHKLNENWLQLSFQEMILLNDKIIKYRNMKKPTDSIKKQRLNIIPWQKRKLKMSNKQAHQNPYVPHRINKQGKMTEDQNQLVASDRQKEEEQLEQTFQKNLNQLTIKERRDDSDNNKSKKKALKQQNSEEEKQKHSQSFIDLPSDFKSYPPEERLSFLQTTYNNSKNNLQKKFNMIYTHYRKQMYIPHQTFKTNEELLLDLRMFLRYYREFQIATKFRASIATNYFKKLAVNGIWLDLQNFNEIHYDLIKIITINEKEISLMLQNGLINNGQSKEMKKILNKNTKVVMQNLIKLKQLTDLISDEKIRKLMNENSGKKIVSKIVEVHSGMIKEDLLQKLKQRIEEKNRKNQLRNDFISVSKKLSTQSPEKISSFSKDMYNSVQSNPSFLSIYRQLLIPKLGSIEMKKSSVYSSLQILNMHKQKQRLKQLINQEQDQKYLEAYFKKEKLLNSLIKSNISPGKNQSQYIANPKTSSQISISIKPESQQNRTKRSVSLPRMKFT